MDFRSDNVTGVCPEILAAIIAANDGAAAAYGEDVWTARAELELADLFERPVSVFPVNGNCGQCPVPRRSHARLRRRLCS